MRELFGLVSFGVGAGGGDVLGFRGDFRYRVLLNALVVKTALIPKACCSGDEKAARDEKQTGSRE